MSSIRIVSQSKKNIKNKSLLIVLAALILVGAIWSTLFVVSTTQKTLDQRVTDVASQLKCPICQGESVADSPSTLAQQMREVIRQQLQSGRSEQQVIQYFVNSYGEQIVWSPPWQGFALLAWLVPITLLLSGLVLLFFTFRAWHTAIPVNAATHEDVYTAKNLDEDELEQYRQQLEQELAAEDSLFQHPAKEVRSWQS